MIEVRQLTMISEDRPTQWEGLVGDQGSIYIRYRRGELEVYVSETSKRPVKDGERILDQRIGRKYDGRMSTDRMKDIVAGVCRFI